MLARGLILLMALSLIAVAGCGEDGGRQPKELGDYLVGNQNDSVSAELEGNWGGRLTQEGLPPFRMAVNFEVGSDPLVAYTGIDCGGTWTLTDTALSNPPYYGFEERINSGAGGECKGTGGVSLHPHEPCEVPEGQKCPYVKLDYSFRGGGVSSKGVLTHISDERLQQTFDEAGVPAT